MVKKGAARIDIIKKTEIPIRLTRGFAPKSWAFFACFGTNLHRHARLVTFVGR